MSVTNTLNHPATAADARSVMPLILSSSSRVWGMDEKQSANPSWTETAIDTTGREALKRDDLRCRFCGFRSCHNVLHHINDNHRDHHADNLATCDIVCHGWHHLADLSAQEAVIAYLPGLSAQDVNHLQRTIAVALASEDAEAKADAMEILNWAASHRDYVKPAWGTYHPGKFADALTAKSAQPRELREFAFAGLALIYHPALLRKTAALWAEEVYANHPVREWGRTFHAVMHAPL